MEPSKLSRKHLPLTEATFYILAALMEPQHGYAVMQEVGGMSEGTVKLGPGTLYGVVTKLEQSKLIKKVGEVERRKIYVITDAGQEVLDDQIDRLGIMLRNASGKRNKLARTKDKG